MGMDTKLNVVNETGENIEIDVIDIFSRDGEEKEFILYSIGEDVYASILIEDEQSFLLKTIDEDNDMQLVTSRISELVA